MAANEWVLRTEQLARDLESGRASANHPQLTDGEMALVVLAALAIVGAAEGGGSGGGGVSSDPYLAAKQAAQRDLDTAMRIAEISSP